MDFKILSDIKSPENLKKLNNEELALLCEEIREVIIETVSKNGGHLASNLGAVELTVAIHRAFSSPEDAIIFDVGHQTYAHKILTGRLDKMPTIRKEDGISGFMRPSESEHDPVVTGHSSNSISAAYGIYKAKRLSGEDGTAVAVIGDGAMTGGMAYEGLNNAGNQRGNFIIILNDNKMSISHNVGAMSRAFTRLRNQPKYHYFKFKVTNLLEKIPFIGSGICKIIYKVKKVIKSFVYKNNIFESLGYNYLGPVDGHNIKAMEDLFNIAKKYNRPSLVHVITTKGKGYTFAESKPKSYHGVSPFDIEKGADTCGKENFSSVAGQTLCELASNNEKICAVTAAMTEGTGLKDFKSNFRARFFDVGIAEQHAVTFCAGLAKGGMIPFFAVYSSFLQRGFDQVIHDCAIANLPVKLLVDRAGIVGEDGESHQGVFDAAFLSQIPNMHIYSPAFYSELKETIKKVSSNDELCAVRYPRGCEGEKIELDYSKDITVVDNGTKCAVITYGRLFSNVYEAAKDIDGVTVIKLNKIYPLSDKLIKLLNNFGKVYFYEEGIKSGGIAEHVGTLLNENGFSGEYKIFAVKNEFVKAASVSGSFKKYGFDVKSIKKTLGEEV